LLPVVVFGVFEQNYKEEVLEATPTLYQQHRKNRLMRKRQLAKWVCLGFWHSLVVFFGW
jgi:phospholipid-translocating ATPase